MNKYTTLVTYARIIMIKWLYHIGEGKSEIYHV